jgi:hypothetical protein
LIEIASCAKSSFAQIGSSARERLRGNILTEFDGPFSVGLLLASGSGSSAFQSKASRAGSESSSAAAPEASSASFFNNLGRIQKKFIQNIVSNLTLDFLRSGGSPGGIRD